MFDPAQLDQFDGTNAYHGHWTKAFVMTDGAYYLYADGAGWLIDAIASYQSKVWLDKNPELRRFQAWILKVKPDHTATLICERDTDDVVITQEIEFTDFPLSEITLFLIKGVLLLPSEY